MKNIKLIVILTHLLIGTLAFAQAPEKMSYQAVIRNTANALVTNQPVGMKISILQGSATGTAVYAEIQTPTSNTNGLVSLEIGGGSVVTGTFAAINWGNGPYFIKTETDPTGGSSYTITGTSQLVSSPYALYAKTAKNGLPTGGTAGQVLSTDGTEVSWINTPGAKLELQATKIAATQALANANGVNTGDIVVYENVTTTPTIGTYSTSTNLYTVGAAGLYYIQAVVRTVDNTGNASNTTNQWLYIDVNNTSLSGLNNIFSFYVTAAPLNFPAGSKGRGAVSGVIYLNSGDVVNIKGLNSNSSVSNAIKNDGSGRFMIVKLN